MLIDLSGSERLFFAANWFSPNRHRPPPRPALAQEDSLRRIRVSVWPLEVAIPQEASTLYLPDLF